MGLLDGELEPLWKPPKGKRYIPPYQTEEQKLSELNNFDREEETEHYEQPE